MWQSSRIAAKVRVGVWLMEQDREVGSLVGNDPLRGPAMDQQKERSVIPPLSWGRPLVEWSQSVNQPWLHRRSKVSSQRAISTKTAADADM